MSLQVEKMEKNMAKLTIEVSAEDVEKGYAERISEGQRKNFYPRLP